MRALVRGYIEGSANPDMLMYGDDFLRYIDRGVWVCGYLMDLTHSRGRRVLDVGCGYGWNALLMARCGAVDVVAVDYRALMTETINRRIAEISPNAGPIPVKAITLDICDDDLEPELIPGSFDTVFCLQAIDCMRDLEKLFATALELLKPGGTIACMSHNNARTPRLVAQAEAMWAKRDRSFEFIEELKKERPIENADAEPYAAMRERIIRLERPDMETKHVDRLVDATAGMIAEDIRGLARGLVPGDALPAPPRYDWCRNPVTGEFCRRLLDPYAVAEQLAQAGFAGPSVHHLFRRFPVRILNRIHYRPWNNLVFKWKPVFAVLASKHREVRSASPSVNGGRGSVSQGDDQPRGFAPLTRSNNARRTSFRSSPRTMTGDRTTRRQRQPESVARLAPSRRGPPGSGRGARPALPSGRRAGSVPPRRSDS